MSIIDDSADIAARLRELQHVPIDFSCRVCGVQCDSAPNPPERAVCPAHCPDHDYVYVREDRRHECKHCGEQPSLDHWIYNP
jgi:hypothetical protein